MDKKRIHELLEHATEAALSEWESKGTHSVDTKEMGEVVDIIKDLACAEKDVWEACYYKSIVEAMEEEEELERMIYKEGRAGYDRWRTAKGRFAPKGTGHETSMAMATGRRGFDGGDKDKTPWTPNPYYDDPRMWPIRPWDDSVGVMGYDRDAGRYDPSRTDGRHAQSDAAASHDARTQWQDARRHYHETGAQPEKMKMDEKAEEYLNESIQTMKDIFVDADPKMQQKMKEDIARLFREMGGNK